MDTLTFIAEMTKALAWPVAVFFAVAVMHKPICKVIENLRIQKLKYGKFEAEFKQEEQKVQKAISRSLLKEALLSGLSMTNTKHTDISSPRAVILRVWQELENFIREAADRHDNVPFSTIIEELVKNKSIQPMTANGLRGLEQLRNLAAHAQNEEELASRVDSFVTMAGALQWTVDQNVQQAKKMR